MRFIPLALLTVIGAYGMGNMKQNEIFEAGARKRYAHQNPEEQKALAAAQYEELCKASHGMFSNRTEENANPEKITKAAQLVLRNLGEVNFNHSKNISTYLSKCKYMISWLKYNSNFSDHVRYNASNPELKEYSLEKEKGCTDDKELALARKDIHTFLQIVGGRIQEESSSTQTPNTLVHFDGRQLPEPHHNVSYMPCLQYQIDATKNLYPQEYKKTPVSYPINASLDKISQEKGPYSLEHCKR